MLKGNLTMKDMYLSAVTVLFVDDEEGVRDSFETLLSMWCKKAYSASDGEKGFEIYQSHQPDIIITDIKMPKSTGLEMISKIREENQEIPIFISTAFENSEYLHEAINLKVSGYLVKPISKKDLKSQISTAAKNIVNEKEIDLINEKNQLYLDMASDLMIALDSKGNIEMLNKYGCKLLGIKLEEIIGKNWFELEFLPLEVAGDVKKYFFKLINEEIEASIEQFENDLIAKDGRRVTLKWQNRVLKDNQGNVTGVFSSAMDITDIKKLEAEKLEQQRLLLTQSKIAALGEMIANISHQWRQPLSVISTYASGLQVNLELGNQCSNEKLKQCTKGIMTQVEYLSKTIEDFIHYYKSDTLTTETFNTRDTVNRLKGLVLESFKDNKINCIFNINDCKLIQNENLLIQAMLNICNNAKDVLIENRSEEERYFFITVVRKEDTITISFKDSGGGIKEDIIDKVFEPYFTTKHQSIGTGIGLYMSNQIISKHFDGNIRVFNVEYEYEGKTLTGAEFIIDIPISSSE